MESRRRVHCIAPSKHDAGSVERRRYRASAASGVLEDAKARTNATGAGAEAANYGRRSPIPMINILRTPQVKAAQKGLPTGLVYSQNEETLGDIGTEKLEEMLRTLDWSAVNDVKVDRSQVEVLKIARKMMAQGGGIKATDDLTLTGGEAAAASAAATKKAAESDMVVADWASAVDEASGSTYDYNTKTGATSWVWPPE